MGSLGNATAPEASVSVSRSRSSVSIRGALHASNGRLAQVTCRHGTHPGPRRTRRVVCRSAGGSRRDERMNALLRLLAQDERLKVHCAFDATSGRHEVSRGEHDHRILARTLVPERGHAGREAVRAALRECRAVVVMRE